MNAQPRSFRDALGQFPTGVALVTAGTPGEQPLGLTISSFNSVSLDPPLVLFSVDRKALRASWSRIESVGIPKGSKA